MAKTYEQFKADVKKQHPSWSQSQVDTEALRLFNIDSGNTTNTPTGGGLAGTSFNILTGQLGSQTAVSGRVFVGKGKGDAVSQAVAGGVSVSTVGDTKSASKLKTEYLENPKVESAWRKTLAKNGFGDAANDPLKAKALYDLSIDGAAGWYQGSNGKRQVTPEQYLGWYGKSQGLNAGPSVSVQKYLFQPEEIQSLIDTTLKGVLGRKATASESKEFYTAIQKMIDQGTVTTTKTVGGKTITEQKPGFSKEKAEAMITEKVKTSATQDYQEKQSLDFADFLGKLKG